MQPIARQSSCGLTNGPNFHAEESAVGYTAKAISSGFLAFAAIAVVPAVTVWADDGKDVRIHLIFRSYYDQIRPQNGASVATNESMIIISSDKSVREVLRAYSPTHDKSWDMSQTLGGTDWHVDGPHRLVKTTKHEQTTEITIIDVVGTKCKASWESRLLPGFHEHKYINLELGGVPAYFRQARMVSSTCTIESN
jgi:hypothetical protein